MSKTIDKPYSSSIAAIHNGNALPYAKLAKRLAVDSGYKGKSNVACSVASWSRGSSVGIVQTFHDDIAPDLLSKLSAKAGLANNSTCVLSFISGSGNETLHYIKTENTDLRKIKHFLNKVKIVSFCIIPSVKGTTIFFYDKKSVLEKNAVAFCSIFSSTHIMIKGTGKYLGSDATDEETARKKARQAYRQELGISETDIDNPGSNGQSGGGKQSASGTNGAGRSKGNGSARIDGLSSKGGTFVPKR